MTTVSRADLLRGRIRTRPSPADPQDAEPSGPRVARIGGACLSFGGVECRVCGDHCGARAIRFRPLGRGRWFPDLDEQLCDGCGDCAAPCPVGAVALIPHPRPEASPCA
jgi:ferredoxin-type protein NapF